MRSPRSSKRFVRLALAGIVVAVVGLAALALAGAVVSERGASAVTSAAVQTTGHLRAVQALSMIDTYTDELEDLYDAALVRRLRASEKALDDGIDRMATGGDRQAARISDAAAPVALELRARVDGFLLARLHGGDDETGAAEDAMEDVIDELETLVHDIRTDPSLLLTSKLEGLTASLGTVRGLALVLAPLGLGFVGLAGWLLGVYRRRSEQAMRSALAVSEAEARTDQLTSLINRRGLLEQLEDAAAQGQELTLALADLDGFKRYNDTYGHAAGDALLRRLAGRLATAFAGRGTAARLGGDEFCVLVHEPTEEHEIHELVRAALTEHGEGFTITASCGVAAMPREAADCPRLLRLADSRMYARKAGGRTGVDELVSRVLLRMLDERHPGLAEHVEHVTELAASCAAAVGMREEDVEVVRRAAELHDVGKVGIPTAILIKPGPLDQEEWEFMRRHTVIGERILQGTPGLQAVAPIVRASHERWDGGGYPDGLAGEQIPLAARIVAVTDAFCAMTEQRPYARARSVPHALDELRRCAGSQFDPAVVAAFVAAVQGRAPLAAVA